MLSCMIYLAFILMDAHAHAIMPLCLSSCLSDASSMHSYISIVASHLGTLDARRVELKDKVGAEPEDDVWWTYPEDGWMDLDVHDRKRVLVKRVSSN